MFHFKDGGEPSDQVLNPDGRDRMASPLILRPWFDGRRYRPAALLLPGWKERVSVRVRLDPAGAATSTSAWPEDPAERERLAARIQPMHDQGAADLLSGFMRFIQEELARGRR